MRYTQDYRNNLAQRLIIRTTVYIVKKKNMPARYFQHWRGKYRKYRYHGSRRVVIGLSTTRKIFDVTLPSRYKLTRKSSDEHGRRPYSPLPGPLVFLESFRIALHVHLLLVQIVLPSRISVIVFV